MVVKVEEIQDKGLTLSEPLRFPLLEELASGTEFRPLQGGTLKAHFLRVSGSGKSVV